MISRRLDPWLLSFVEAVEQELASALETRHRRGDRGDNEVENASVTSRSLNERIAALRGTIGALQAALGRGESSVVH